MSNSTNNNSRSSTTATIEGSPSTGTDNNNNNISSPPPQSSVGATTLEGDSNNNSNNLNTLTSNFPSRRVTIGGMMDSRRNSLGLNLPGPDSIGDIFGRRPSIGFDVNMDFLSHRRDSLDSTTAVLDAAILDLTRRRLSMAVGSSTVGTGNSNDKSTVAAVAAAASMSNANGAHNGAHSGVHNVVNSGVNNGVHNGVSAAAAAAAAVNHTSNWGNAAAAAAAAAAGNAVSAVSASSMMQTGNAATHAHGAAAITSFAARQQQLQQQQRELEQRQKELEIQRQQLLAGMQDAKNAMMQVQQHQSLMNGGGMSLPGSSIPTQPGMPRQQWWVCRMCNAKAFASHEEAMSHEASCTGGSTTSGPLHPDMPLPINTDLSLLTNRNVGNNNVGNHHHHNNNININTNNTSNINSFNITGLNEHSGGGAIRDASSSLSAGPFAMMPNPMPLAMNSDKDWLTPLHCFVRRHCVQVFTATQNDVATPSKGKRKPIQVGQVGIRCPHCHADDSTSKARERGSVYYPTTISSVYNATMNLLQRHLHHCTSVPQDIMKSYETLKGDDARSGTSKRYWQESALSLGLVDTPNGIRFSALRPPPLPSLSRQQHSTGAFSAGRRNSNDFFSSTSNAVAELSSREGGNNNNTGGLLTGIGDDGGRGGGGVGVGVGAGTATETVMGSGTGPALRPGVGGVGPRPGGTEGAGGTGRTGGGPTGAALDSNENSAARIPETEQSLAQSAPLVTPEDEPYSTAFSFHLLSQMQPCVFTEADRLGKRKGLPPGFPGLACRHCFGGYGSGRFFPSSIKTLSDTSKTLNVLHNHMQRCRKCPQEVRGTLEKLRVTHDEERAKMKFGSQKAFFARIWDRLHKSGQPVEANNNNSNKKRKLSGSSNNSGIGDGVVVVGSGGLGGIGAGVGGLMAPQNTGVSSDPRFGPPSTTIGNISVPTTAAAAAASFFGGGLGTLSNHTTVPDPKLRRTMG